MKIKTRLIILLIFLILLLFTAFIVSRNYDKKTLVLLFQNESAEEERFFDKLILLKNKPLETLAFDYSYWDKMVTCIQSSDIEWAESNLDTCLNTYDANAIWIYKPDLSLVYSHNNINDVSLKEVPIPKEAVTKKLFTKENRFCHFFIDTMTGLMEIRGAAIHTSQDVKRKDPPQGYLFAGKVWDKKYISELSELTKSKITISPAINKESAVSSNPIKGEILFYRILKDYTDAAFKKINIAGTSEIIVDYDRRTKKYFFALTLLFFIIVGIFSLFTLNWLGMPIYLIANALKTEDLNQIDNLENARTEFGDIARLIKNFFKQKKELLTEITERKKIEETLMTSKECFHSIVEKSTDGIIIADADRIVRFINPAAEFFLGNKYLIGSVFNYLILVKEITEITIIRRNNEKGIGEMRAAETIWDKAGAYLITIQDITPGKEIQKNQRLSQLGKLAADMAHEINNPLMIISGNAQISLLEDIDNQTVKNNLAVIYEQSHKAKYIVQRLLKFSRTGKNELKKENINKLLEEAILLIRHQFKLRGIEIKTNYMDNPPLALLNPQQIQEVFINLLNNAKDAIAGNGIIEITSCLENNFLRVDFRDTGCGMAEKDLEKILEPFFTTKTYGTGLGLSLCYNIIKMHNGELKISSIAEKGTTITLLLPIAEDKDSN